MTSKKPDKDPMLEAVRLLQASGHHEAASDLAAQTLEARAAADTPAPPSDTKGETEGAMVLRLVNDLPGRDSTSTPMFDEKGQS